MAIPPSASAALSASAGPQLSASEQRRLVAETESLHAELASTRALLQSQAPQLQSQAPQLQAQAQQLQALLVSSQAQSEFAMMQALTQLRLCRQLQGMEGIWLRNNAYLCIGPSYLLITLQVAAVVLHIAEIWFFH